MSDMKTDNEIIAEFMKLERKIRDNGQVRLLHDGYWIPIEKIYYNTSWDWLMPVVEKIHLLREVEQVSISPGKTRIWFAKHLKEGYIESPCKPENDSITECYLVVVEFIKWYNSQTQH